MNKDPWPMAVVGTVMMAILCTVLVPDGWLMWFPVMFALAVIAKLWPR